MAGLKTILRGKRGVQSGFLPGFMSGLLPAVAILCLVLLAMLVVAQVTHLHSNQSDADHCQLCIAMHSVVPFVVYVAGVLLIRIGTTALPPLEVRTICRNWHPILFSRPPPAGC